MCLHVVVSPLVLAVAVAVLIDDGLVLVLRRQRPLRRLVAEVARQHEVLQILVVLLLPSTDTKLSITRRATIYHSPYLLWG